MQLQNKVAVVTGASRGIGRAIAARLAQEGAALVLHYRGNEQAMESALAEVRRRQPIGDGGAARVVALPADLADLDAVRELWRRVDETFDHIDILVNNAGTAEFHTLEEATPEHFSGLFDLNVRGLFFNTQEAARRMADGGRIVNLSSGITRVNAAGGSVYSASKAAVEAFTRCWAAELGPRGITVNAVSPGMTETELMRQVMPPEALQAAVKETPLGRLGHPEDIADVVTFLCSDQACWLTAQNLLANGGR